MGRRHGCSEVAIGLVVTSGRRLIGCDCIEDTEFEGPYTAAKGAEVLCSLWFDLIEMVPGREELGTENAGQGVRVHHGTYPLFECTPLTSICGGPHAPHNSLSTCPFLCRDSVVPL